MRKTIRKAILAAVLAVLLSLPAAATNYYVDNFGSDDSVGTSIETAWATLTHACTQNMDPGDTLFIMGGTYTSENCWCDYDGRNSGTAESPFVIKAYGDSVATFSGGVGANCGGAFGDGRDWRNYFVLYPWSGTPQHVILDGFSYLSPSDSLYLVFQGEEDTQHLFSVVEGEDIKIRGIEVDGSTCSAFSGGADDVEVGIYYQETARCTIQSNYVHHIHHPTGNIGGDNSERAQNAGHGIWLTSAELSLVEKNTVERCNHGAIEVVKQFTGSTPSRYNTIRNNLVNQHYGGGLYVGFGSQYNLYDRNIVVNCGKSTDYQKPAMQLSGSYNTIRRNVLFSPHNQVMTFEATSDQHSTDTDGNYVYNNTLHDGWYSLNMLAHAGMSMDENILANNIMAYADTLTPPDMDNRYAAIHCYARYVTGDASWLDVCNTTSALDDINWGGNLFTDNCLHREDTDSTVAYFRESGCSGTDWYWWEPSFVNDSDEWSGNFNDAPGLTSTDPESYGVTGDWWHLASGSPCIDAGTSVDDTLGAYVEGLYPGYGWDTLTWYGDAPDVGAYESSGFGAGDTCCIVSHLDFYAVYIDSTSIDSFAVYNCGDSVLVDTLAPSEWEAPFVLTSDSTYSVSAGEYAWFVVEFTPTALGTYADTIDAGHEECDDVRLAGQGLGFAICELVTSPLAFGGDVDTGATKVDSFYLRNDGDSALVDSIDWATLPVFTLQSDSAYTIAAGDSVWFSVQFAPTEITAYADTQDMGHAECADLVITGTGSVTDTCCEVSSVAFGSCQLGDSETDSFYIYNPGDSSLVDSIDWTADLEYTLVSDSSYSLDKGDTAWFSVAFAPLEVKQYPDTVDAGHAACADIILSGYGWAPRTVEPAPPAEVFGPIIWQRATNNGIMRSSVIGSSMTGKIDAVPCETPVVSNITLSEHDTSFAVITFDTDINASGQLRYLKQGGSQYSYSPAQPTGNTTSHACTILDAEYGDVTYHWMVRACYPGRLACASSWSGDSTYTTTCGTDEIYISPHYMFVDPDFGACIAYWSTQEFCHYKQVAWKASTSGTWLYSGNQLSASSTEHNVFLGVDLFDPNKTYHWKVRNMDDCDVQWDYGPVWEFTTDDDGLPLPQQE